MSTTNQERQEASYNTQSQVQLTERRRSTTQRSLKGGQSTAADICIDMTDESKDEEDV